MRKVWCHKQKQETESLQSIGTAIFDGDKLQIIDQNHNLELFFLTSRKERSFFFIRSYKMGAEIGILLIVLNLLTISHSIDEIRDSCPIEARLNLSEEIPDAFGLVKKSEYVFPPESTWFQDNVMFGCICYTKPCLPLCCPLEMGKSDDGVCVLDDKATSFNIPMLHSVNLTFDQVEVNTQNFHVVVSDPCIGTGHLKKPETFADGDYYLSENGSNYLLSILNDTVYNIEDYCLWRFENDTNYIPLVCSQKLVYDESFESISVTIAIAGIIISILFLLVTFLIYTILPEMKNIHGLTMRGYVGSLLVAYSSVLIHEFSVSTRLRTFVEVTSQFSLLASFFWLNVMCFDIWWTFGRLNLFRKSNKRSNRKRCLIYSIYAWGCAFLFTAMCSVVENVPCEKPRLCWFEEVKIIMDLCLFGPITVTVPCNIFFCILTAVKLNRNAKEAARNLESIDSERHNNNKYWFNLCLKLFLMTGSDWSVQVILIYWQGPIYLQVITLVWHVLQGPIVFTIFILKRNIIRLTIQRFGCRVPNFLRVHGSSLSQTGTTTVPPSE